jgi:hypothetical protein
MLTQEKLKEHLHYNPETGVWTWIKSPRSKVQVGDTTGHIDVHGYVEIGFLNRIHKAHRLAWIYMTGENPKSDLDHINNIKHDNRWVNLRLATRPQNVYNSKLRSDNTSGYRGVSYKANVKKWCVQVTYKGKRRIKTYDTKEEAIAIYAALAEHIQGDFLHKSNKRKPS